MNAVVSSWSSAVSTRLIVRFFSVQWLQGIAPCVSTDDLEHHFKVSTCSSTQTASFDPGAPCRAFGLGTRGRSARNRRRATSTSTSRQCATSSDLLEGNRASPHGTCTDARGSLGISARHSSRLTSYTPWSQSAAQEWTGGDGGVLGRANSGTYDTSTYEQ